MPSEAEVRGGTLVKAQTPIALHTDLRALVELSLCLGWFLFVFLSDVVKQSRLMEAAPLGQNVSPTVILKTAP